MSLFGSPSFLIPLIYGLIAMAFYVWVATTLIINRKVLKSSFYRLFLAGFVMNLCTYINSFISLRLPRNTGADDAFAPLFSFFDPYNSAEWPVNIFHTLHYQFAYAQYIFNCLVCLNRFTLIFFPMNSEKIWRTWYWAFVAFIYLAPFTLTFWIIRHRSFYRYSSNHDYFWIDSTFGRGNIYTTLTPFLIAITILNIFFNFSSYWKMREMSSQGLRVPQKSLLVMSFVVFAIDMFLTVLAILNAILTIWNPDNTSLNVLSYIVTCCTPYASDLLTLTQPFLLFMFSKTVRRKCIELFPCTYDYRTRKWFANSKSIAFVHRNQPSSTWR